MKLRERRRRKRIAMSLVKGVKASPSALKLILKVNVNINDIKGTGKDGTITLSDVQKHIKAQG